MITLDALPDDRPAARSLPFVFSNYTRCRACRGISEIRAHYCPGCPSVRGAHFHRLCRCGAEWLERSAAHSETDIRLNDPRFCGDLPALREAHGSHAVHAADVLSAA